MKVYINPKINISHIQLDIWIYYIKIINLNQNEFKSNMIYFIIFIWFSSRKKEIHLVNRK